MVYIVCFYNCKKQKETGKGVYNKVFLGKNKKGKNNVSGKEMKI